ncbi:MAG: hypothetical protein R3191_06070, partial [Anaerolineales bacterium]|nr:hypothetical protein [Anaerolineales bacterium]
GIVFVLWSTSLAELSAWADASTMLLILPVLAIAVIPLLLAAAAVYLVQLLINAIPAPAHRAQVAMREVARRAERASELAMRPWVAAEGVSAAARRGWARLTSVFQR